MQLKGGVEAKPARQDRLVVPRFGLARLLEDITLGRCEGNTTAALYGARSLTARLVDE